MPYEAQLKSRLDDAQRASEFPLSRAEITSVVQEVIRNMSGDLSATNIQVFEEINHLAQTIENARSEIAALRPDELQARDLPGATDELDAVVGATEEATNKILTTCEEMLDKFSAKLAPEHQSELTDYVTQIFEACNFQDVTGQRITKVVKTLKVIEERVGQLLKSFGPEIEEIRKKSGASDGGPTGDAALLNGPQMPANAIGQDDIDALLASLGG